MNSYSILKKAGNFEPTPETHKIKKVSFGDLYIFFNELILRHDRISINVNLIQNKSFCEKCLFLEWTQLSTKNIDLMKD